MNVYNLCWNYCAVTAVDVIILPYMVCEAWKKSTFPFIKTLSRILWFFTWIFWMLLVVLSLQWQLYCCWVLCAVKDHKGHGCGIPLKRCVGALPSLIFTLLASFHRITAQCKPHSHINVKTLHMCRWAGRMCEKDVWRGFHRQTEYLFRVQTASRRWGSNESFSCLHSIQMS